MPTLDAGLFVILAGLAFAFMFLSFKLESIHDGVLKLLSMVLFFSLAIFLSAEYDVVYVETATDGTSTWTTTKFLIDDNQQILAMIFYALGLANIGLYLHSMFQVRAERNFSRKHGMS